MLHIRPVLEEDASEKVREAYADIKKTLSIHFVPLVFQYIAGFEEYFLYSWEKIKTNLTSDYYKNAAKEMMQLSQKSIHEMYRESKEMRTFIGTVQSAEKQTITQTVKELEQLNANLLILTIGLREGVKGVMIGQSILQRSAGEYEETVFDAFINQKIMHANVKAQEKNIAPASKMLAPLFGGSSLIVNKYPEFFAHIAGEMDELVKTEKYLHERVIMERAALTKALHLPYSLGCSYAEIASFAAKLPYFSELLYILSETFPTKFPRLVFTTALMQYVLSDKQGLAAK